MSESDELLLDVLWQACGESEDGLIDNRALSAYENACIYLWNKGLIKKKNSRLYFLKKQDIRTSVLYECDRKQAKSQAGEKK